jgi:hypothetical protein
MEGLGDGPGSHIAGHSGGERAEEQAAFIDFNNYYSHSSKKYSRDFKNHLSYTKIIIKKMCVYSYDFY